MIRRLFTAATLAALALPAAALTNSDFSNFGTGWTMVTGGSGSVNFDGTKCTLTAFTTSSAGIEQTEALFTTLGQEFEMSVTVLNNGNVEAGWRNASDVVFASTIYASGATGTRTVKTDSQLHTIVFVEKVGATGGIIDIDDVTATEITAPPSAGTILSVTRSDYDNAVLTWTAATDNVSPTNQIVYDVYYSTNSANVISEGVKDSFTGVAGGTVSGIPTSQVFFTVRARDRVGNQESNTTQLTLPAVTSVDEWTIYR